MTTNETEISDLSNFLDFGEAFANFEPESIIVTTWDELEHDDPSRVKKIISKIHASSMVCWSFNHASLLVLLFLLECNISSDYSDGWRNVFLTVPLR